MDEQVPEWFENLDDAEIERRERESRGARFWILLVVVLIVLGMAVVPTLNLLDLDREPSRPELRLSPTRQVAWDFGEAVLATRSVDEAMRLAAPDQRPAVAAIVDDLLALDQPSLDRARLGIGVTRCVESAPVSSECFLAWLYETGRPEFARIRYVVANKAGAPLVVRVERVMPSTAGR